MRATRVVLGALLGASPCFLGACVFGPVTLEGRTCATTADCIQGYECSAERVCVLAPDVGRPDAGRPDAFVRDVGRDAPLDTDPLDAPEGSIDLDAGSPDVGPIDAAAVDATPTDARSPVDAPPDAPRNEDAAASPDAPLDAGGEDAPAPDAAADAP